MIKLKFIQNYAPYKKGDIAGFRNKTDADTYLNAKRDKKAVAKKIGRGKAMSEAPEDKAVKSADNK